MYCPCPKHFFQIVTKNVTATSLFPLLLPCLSERRALFSPPSSGTPLPPLWLRSFPLGRHVIRLTFVIISLIFLFFPRSKKDKRNPSGAHSFSLPLVSPRSSFKAFVPKKALFLLHRELKVLPVLASPTLFDKVFPDMVQKERRSQLPGIRIECWFQGVGRSRFSLYSPTRCFFPLLWERKSCFSSCSNFPSP